MQQEIWLRPGGVMIDFVAFLESLSPDERSEIIKLICTKYTEEIKKHE